MRRWRGRILLPAYRVRAPISPALGAILTLRSSYRALEAYLSSPSTQHAIGVDDAVRGNFSMINMDVNELFWARNDAVPSATTHVAALLERGVRVLAYVGDYDFVCNWVGIERWTRELEWTGGEQFANQPLRVWKVDGAEAGKVRSYGNFTYATVHGAGHLVRDPRFQVVCGA